MIGLQNLMRREAVRANQQAFVRHAIVSAYDPSHYAAKVLIQPEGFETGFLPIQSPWVGAGWGLFCPPTPGDVVDVHFQEGGKEAGFVALRFFGNLAPPLSTPSGEFWLVHKSGSSLKFHNDGTIEINATGDMNVTAPNVNLTGDFNVTGNILATGDISDQNATNGTVAHIRAVYDGHTHDTPSGTSDVPNQPL